MEALRDDQQASTDGTQAAHKPASTAFSTMRMHPWAGARAEHTAYAQDQPAALPHSAVLQQYMGACTETQCELKSIELGLPFSTQLTSNGAPAGCIRYNDGRVIFVETCSGHAYCGTFSCHGCSVLECATAPPLAQMCMDPATFMPNEAPHYQCHTSNSDDPAVEADCPEECWGESHLDEVDGTMKYYCECEASSAEECAEKYPGEQAAERL